MLLRKNKIEIVFINEEINDNELEEEFRKKLRKKYIFKFNRFTKIKRLLLYLNKRICSKDNNSLSDIYEHYLFCKDDVRVKANANYGLKQFLSNYYPNKQLITMEYVIGIGGGNGVYIDELANFRINPNEANHKYHPHIHLYKNNYKKSISIDLIKLEERKQNKYKLSDFFSKKEIDEIYGILRSNRDELIDYYNRVQNGEEPQEITLEHNNKKFIFK